MCVYNIKYYKITLDKTLIRARENPRRALDLLEAKPRISRVKQYSNSLLTSSIYKHNVPRFKYYYYANDIYIKIWRKQR